jgi:hypothetical protein
MYVQLKVSTMKPRPLAARVSWNCYLSELAYWNTLFREAGKPLLAGIQGIPPQETDISLHLLAIKSSSTAALNPHPPPEENR